MRIAAAALLVVLAAPPAARAEPHPLRYDLRVDAAIAAGAAVLYLSSELAKERLAPSRCRLCEPNAFDEGARRALVWGYGYQARRTSDALALLLPAAAVTHQVLAARAAGDVEAGWVDALVVAETALLAMNLNQLTKYTVGRQRPFVRFGNREGDREPDPDDNLSFYSGHTTFTFAVAAAAGTVSDLRGYRGAPWVWGVGMTLAATTGYLRIAADRHFLTDVLVGAALGTAAGIALPRVLHGREEGEAAPSAGATIPVGLVLAF